MTGALLVDTSLTEATLNGTILANADLTRSNLRKATLIGTVLDGASLRGCMVYGVSAWSLDLSKVANQSELVVTDFEEAEITVDNLELAQFVYLMLHNHKIRDIIDTVTGKGVLILGRFTCERKAVLDGIRDRLREHNFVPMVFDWDKSPGRDLTETVQLLANMSRFVVADVTDAKSIPQELQSIVPNLPSVPVRPIILAGQREYAMFEHFKPYPWVLDVFAYDDINHLVDNLEQAIISPITQWEAGSGENIDVADELRAKDQEIERLRAELAASRAKD